MRAKAPKLDALVTALRAAGLGIGVTDSLRVAAVVRAASHEAKARAFDLGELRDLLRCVVASTLEERATFDRVWSAWCDAAQRDLDVAPRIPESGPAPLPPPPPERRAPRWLPRILAAVALGMVLAVVVLVARLLPGPVVEVADAGTVQDSDVVEQDDAGVQRPTTFPAREVVFTVEPPQAERALPWQVALALASAALAVVLARMVRKSSWLPRVLAPPKVAGPPEVPPLPVAAGTAGAALFTAAERDDLAFAVDRFVREEPSPEIDARRTIDATIAAGGCTR